MKRLVYLFLVVAVLSDANGQALDEVYKESTVRRIADLINQNYVFPEVAKAIDEHLQAKLTDGTFQDITDLPTFSRALTREAQAVNHDKHMRIRVNNSNQMNAQRERNDNGGFKESKIMEGNIGYIDMRAFVPASEGVRSADEHMKRVYGVDALILDLRNNGGGDPEMVRYLCSYFFIGRIHLNNIYSRTTGTTTEFWTTSVHGTKMPDVPLYVLTSSFTFSGAEEFCYNMQTQHRATLIGEITGGGANPGDSFGINDQLSIFIPTGRAINPVTGTNWEGIGVTPEVKVHHDEALSKAIEMARLRVADARKK